MHAAIAASLVPTEADLADLATKAAAAAAAAADPGLQQAAQARRAAAIETARAAAETLALA